MVFLKEFSEEYNFEKNRQITKHHVTFPSMPLAQSGSTTINVPNFSNTLSFLFLNKTSVIRAGFHKLHVRKANRQDPDQTASSEAVRTGSALFA